MYKIFKSGKILYKTLISSALRSTSLRISLIRKWVNFVGSAMTCRISSSMAASWSHVCRASWCTGPKSSSPICVAITSASASFSGKPTPFAGIAWLLWHLPHVSFTSSCDESMFCTCCLHIEWLHGRRTGDCRSSLQFTHFNAFESFSISFIYFYLFYFKD